MSDVAVERCDGLGWYFGLFFIIHAAVPGVAATVAARQLGGEHATLLVAASVLAYVPLVLVVRGALNKKARIAQIREMLATGHRTYATIVHFDRLLGNSKSGGKRYGRAAVKMLVEGAGFAPYEVETRAWYRGSDLARLLPGTRVPVVVSTQDHNEVVITEVPEAPVWGGHQAGGAFWGGAPAMPMAAHAVTRASRRRMIVALAVGIAVSGITVGGLFLALSFDGEAVGVLEKFFRACKKEDYEAAYALLSEDLQEQIGSPEELGERWEAAGVEVKLGKLGCSRGGTSRIRIGRGAEVARSGPDGPFRLGHLPPNKCSRAVTADLAKERGKLRIVALEVD